MGKIRFFPLSGNAMVHRMSKRSIEFYTGGPFQTNGYVIPFVEGDEVIVVDAPEGITRWLIGHGHRVGAILLTHLHYDHVIDVSALKKAFPEAPVMAYSQPNRDLTLETVLEGRVGWDIQIEPFSVDQILEGESSLKIGGETIELLHVPGHSPDSLGFYFADEAKFFAGDTLFDGSVGRADFSHSDEELLRSGIRDKIYQLPDQTVVFPGHGGETSVGVEKRSNPFVRA